MPGTNAVYLRQGLSEDEAQGIAPIDTKPPQDVVEHCKRAFGKIPKMVMEAELTARQFQVYAYLATCTNKSAMARVKLSTMARDLGLDKGNLSKVITQLEDETLVLREHVGLRGQRASSTRYRLRLHNVEPFGRLMRHHVTNTSVRAALPVLAALSMHANEEGKAWPFQSDLAEDLRTTPRAIRRKVALLEGAGLIEIGQNKSGRNYYWVEHHRTLTTTLNADFGKKGQMDRTLTTTLPDADDNPTPDTDDYPIVSEQKYSEQSSEEYGALRLARFAAGPMDGPYTKHAHSSEDVCDADWAELEESELSQQASTEQPRAEPVYHLYNEPAGPSKPLTDIEQAKDALLDLMRVPELRRLSLVGLSNASLESQLQAKLDVVGIEGWLDDIKQITADPETHKHITAADLLAA